MGIQTGLYAETSWCVQDVMDTYKCTRKKAERFLEKYADDIEKAMVSAGWDAIYEAAREEGLEPKG